MAAIKGEVQKAINDPRVRRSLSYVGASTVNQQLFDRGIRHAILFEGLKTTEVNRVVRYFNNEIAPDVVNTLRSRLAKAKKLGVDRGPWTTRYYKDMMNEVLGTVRGGMANTSKRVTEQLTKIGYAEAQFSGSAIESALPFNFDARVPSVPMVRSIVKNSPVNGKLVSTWFKELGDSMQGKIVQQVNVGLATGEGVQKIVRRLTSQGGVFDVTKRNAEALVRTQMTHVSNNARELTYDQNQDVIKGVRYVATLDARTTDICAGLDGQVFKPTEGPRPPLHMRCRSTTVPVTKSWNELGKEFKVDAFKKLKEPKTEAMLRSSMNGSVPAKTTYNAWLKTQPKAFQNQVLGPRRATIFRRGNLHLSRFTDYGAFPPRPLTVDKLLSLEQAITAGKASGGAVPFEAVMKTTPKKKVVRKAPPKKATRKSSPKKRKAEDLDADNFERIGPQAGSNPGGVFRNTKTDENWYLKFPEDIENARNEVLAARLYREMGVNVPEVRLVQRNGKTGVASRMRDRVYKFDKNQPLNVADDFVADAYLGNWDVVGLNFDNILAEGAEQGMRILRVDTGGALRYRAQGGLKGSAWGDTVGELETLVSKGMNPQSAMVFGRKYRLALMDDLSSGIERLKNLEEGIDKVRALSPAKIRRLVDRYGPLDAGERLQLTNTLIARRQDLVTKQKMFRQQRRSMKAQFEKKQKALQTAVSKQNEFTSFQESIVRVFGTNPKNVPADEMKKLRSLYSSYKRAYAKTDLEENALLSMQVRSKPKLLKAGEWEKSLSKNEFRAINDFTGSVFGQMRGVDEGLDYYWHSGGKRRLNAETIDMFKDHVRNVYSAYERSEKYSGVVYRGLRDMPANVLDDMFQQGAVYRSEAMSSFTLQKTVAARFAGTGDEGVAVVIRARFNKQGINIHRKVDDWDQPRSVGMDNSGYVSGYKADETEILLGKGERFKVVRVDKSNPKQWEVELEPLN